jgi:perosamine synthetase
MTTLAILGGTPEISQPFAPYNRIGEAERAAADRVLTTGVLSGFVGAQGPDFNGGPEVQALESEWCATFGAQHAISVNSATSGLYAALGAAQIGPGDEVIVPPYTMSATAMAPLVYGAIPVFADIEEDTFCLDPVQVRRMIGVKTRAILAVNLFGHPARLHELRALADEKGLLLIEDNAQAPLATEFDRYAGTVGHIGVFSLNRHKHIQTGEGGICTTDDADLALRLRLIRNHGENLVDHYEFEDIANLVGFNYRLTEISAAIGRAQLAKAETIMEEREGFARRLSAAVSGLPGITPPVVREGCRHVYYAWPARYDPETVGVSREVFVKALAAEGVAFDPGYVEPLYLLPVFQRRVAIGRDGFPFNQTNRQYNKGLCPVAERMHFEEEIGFGICSYELSDELIDAIANAVHKVYEGRAELRKLEPAA